MSADVDIQVRSAPASAGPAASRLQQLYLNRGAAPEEMDLSLGQLLRPEGLPDIEKAATRIAAAVTGGERILIVGDFDADGATSVALSMLVFKAFGAGNVDFLVPNRFEFGYGLSPEIVELAKSRGDVVPDLLITVDNGIASVTGVERANAAGIDVIVTDHHLPGSELPAACAVVNPMLPDANFASRALAGVGVIYYVLSATRKVLAEADWFGDRPIPNLAQFLDLVALGTVADVVPLDRNNRILVQQGLLRMRAGRARPGIKALLEFAKRDARRLVASDLGFALGPRLNAAGRLDDISIGIRCLITDDMAEARSLAKALDELNRVRRELEQDMVAEAQLHAAQAMAAVGADQDALRGIAVYDALWHQGVVGLVAGRLKDALSRPVVAFAEAGDAAPAQLKGSARSVAGVHIRDVLDEIATQYPGLIAKFGGHAMAAGLTINRIHFKQFAKIFDQTVAAHLPVDALHAVFVTDGELRPDEFDLGLAIELRNGGPWGQGFPEPSFVGEFEVVSERVVGERHLKLTLKSADRLLDAIAFGTPPVAAKRVRAVYRLDENVYRDRQTLQLMVEHIAPLAINSAAASDAAPQI